MRRIGCAVLSLFACAVGTGDGRADPKGPAKPAATPTAGSKQPGAKATLSPVEQRAAALREAAELLIKAQRALEGGNRNLADMLFSSAELLSGASAVADLAEAFRAGAPPRVDTPITAIPDRGKQPVTVGSSEEEDGAPAKPERGSLRGTITIAGKSGGGLAMLTLEPLSRKAKARAAKSRIMEQRDREFAPRLMIIPVGSKVAFPNYDPYFHNVFSTDDSAKFDLGLYKQGQAREFQFDKEGIIRLGCNLHANMSATIVVVGQPHYVIAGADGTFAFRSLAPGKYRLRAWSDATMQPKEQEIEIRAGKNDITVDVAANAKKGPRPDKFGAARGR